MLLNSYLFIPHNTENTLHDLKQATLEATWDNNLRSSHSGGGCGDIDEGEAG